ncbi:MAG: hypothetical protein HY360_04495 [Verrucomicrobia bacterium]|nr:hypothetical protein [Verrucomicrobiota bacterium]
MQFDIAARGLKLEIHFGFMLKNARQGCGLSEDHVDALPELRARYTPTVIASPNEPVDGATLVREGAVIRCGALTIRVLETDGHT